MLLKRPILRKAGLNIKKSGKFKMDIEALFKISQGLYITGAVGKTDRLVGSCIDAVMLVEMNPAQVFVSLCKTSYTCQTILEKKQFSLSVLSKESDLSVIREFGFYTSASRDKWENVPYFLEDDLPILTNCTAYFILSVKSMLETEMHVVFLCSVEKAVANTQADVLLYNDYRTQIKLNNERKKENE